jgi:hypothetical protein
VDGIEKTYHIKSLKTKINPKPKNRVINIGNKGGKAIAQLPLHYLFFYVD